MRHYKTQFAIAAAAGLMALGAAGTASATMVQDSVTANRSASDFDKVHGLYRNDSTLYQPRDSAVTISGNINLDDLTSGGAVLIGLVDADFYENVGDVQSYQSGAYAYFAPSRGTRSFGVSDGNAGGGELVQNFGDLNGNTDVDFSFTIKPDGTLSLTYDGQTVTDTYGDIKSAAGFGLTPYARDEFANGAYLSVDLSSAAGAGQQTVDFDVNVEPSPAADVPEPGSLGLLGIGLMTTMLVAIRRRRNSEF